MYIHSSLTISVTSHIHFFVMSTTELNYLSLGLIAFGVSAAVVQRYVAAPYGKHAPKQGSKHYFGPEIPPRWGWMIMETPAIYVTLITYYLSTSSTTPFKSTSSSLNASSALLSLFIIHYIGRSLVFPQLIAGGKPMPIAVVGSAWSFCAYNGYTQARGIAAVNTDGTLRVTDTHCIIGIIVFFVGWAINQHSDHILRSLRSFSKGKNRPATRSSSTNGDYKVPYGGMFDYVSAANYFGEIVEWTGYAIACWNLPAAAFAVFTAIQLGGRGLSYHSWYKEKFGSEYPSQRKAVIPFFL